MTDPTPGAPAPRVRKTLESILADGHAILVSNMRLGKLLSVDMAGTPHIWFREAVGAPWPVWAALAFPQVTCKSPLQAGRDLLIGPIAVAWTANDDEAADGTGPLA